ncbi:ABC transporter permease [Fusibacter bizertensis]|uniref:ABC transporter permease n=1 Tax=Fusibacter bizertensis TaxID=1488331 RepID=A0ABT6NA91_9FIRM|nr:ABC transporter permease [Fusibacter bizertensis]MDH8677319.1 ABC transporter permease [Fusibacter bizertensis]
MSEQVISKDLWEAIPKENKDAEIISRPSMTYWQDAWRRLKKNKLSMVGLLFIVFMVLTAIVGPYVISHDYSTQELTLANIPPSMEIYQVDEDTYFYMHSEYKLFDVTKDGVLVEKIKEIENDMTNRRRVYNIDGNEVVLDYSYAVKKAEDNPEGIKFKLLLNGEEIKPFDKVHNKTYVFGTDALGRDMLARVIYGARISLLIALVATLVNFFIGVLYGGISGYFGGQVDNVMMRIVDIINVIPLLLYVILLSVIIGSGLKSIIIALGSVYWVGMARIVRGQVLSLKEQEYVLSARTIGASSMRIMIRHLIPNAMGPIIVSMAMLIPSAIFTEAFLSFIGLGVSAPLASWGTLANDALGGLRSYPYQLFVPSIAISLTMLAFNFLGDGLRDALDPRLRK